MRLFHKPDDYEAFERALAEGFERYPVDLLTYCVMPNHWHLVVRPEQIVALGRWVGWIGVTHVRRHHEHYHSRGGGHFYQGRFKSFPVAEDEYSGAVPLRRSEPPPGRIGRAGRTVARKLNVVDANRPGTGIAVGGVAFAAVEELGGRVKGKPNEEQLDTLRTCVHTRASVGPAQRTGPWPAAGGPQRAAPEPGKNPSNQVIPLFFVEELRGMGQWKAERGATRHAADCVQRGASRGPPNYPDHGPAWGLSSPCAAAGRPRKNPQ